MRSTRPTRSTQAARSTGGAARHAGAGRGRRWRRALLGTLALGAIAAPAISAGCVAGFDPPSLVDGLRVFAVVADKPYAAPGEEVTFRIHYQDGLGGPEDGSRPVTVYWFGGCENPIGDDYYGCYPQFAELAEKFDAWQRAGDPTAPLPDLNGVRPSIGDAYTIKIGEGILDGRKPPASGPAFGSAYVFFVACTGTLGPVEDQGTGRAGTFPVACFDGEGRRLGPDSFVPGYTQVYVFEVEADPEADPGADPEDGAEERRRNANPALNGLTFDGDEMSEDVATLAEATPCPIDAEERREVGCNARDPIDECRTYTIEAMIPEDVAENDPDAKLQTLKEIVWVNYFADLGDIDGGIKLVSDASRGYLGGHAVTWIPPAEPGIATITAVVRDTRGGSSVVQRLVRVK
ncbi:hypothetical protein WMF18_11305 [Sorangium sp. So ce315]|uniref:hypothetical protein n=1 Tax=Sorangium sp. So ce315 TaxID=3133299 RepID=UPI003F623D52